MASQPSADLISFAVAQAATNKFLTYFSELRAYMGRGGWLLEQKRYSIVGVHPQQLATY